MRFHNLKAPLKVSIAFAMVLTAIIGVGAVLFANLTALERADRNMARAGETLTAAGEARFALARQENSLRGYILSRESYYIRRIVELHRPIFEAQLAKLKRLNTGDAAALTEIAALNDAAAAWRDSAAEPAMALAARPQTQAQAFAMIGETGEADVLMGAAEDALKAVEDTAKRIQVREAATKARAAMVMKLALIVGIALTALIAAAMGWILLDSMAAPIVALTGVMRRLASGDNAAEVPALSRRDEIGHMASAVATFREGAIAKAALEAEAETRRRETMELAIEAQAASRAKSEFLATMTHELRTPLNGILGMTQIMCADVLTPEQRNRLATIEESGRALLDVISDILDISKIEAGRLEIRPAPFDLGKFADDLNALYRPLAADKQLAFSLTTSVRARGWFQSDPMRLRQVASNLISNALKFTSTGEVRVSLDVEAGQLRFTVADTGMGVPADQQATLFDRFTQADASSTRRHGGAGLGLAICKEIVGLLGGAISVDSRTGEGSTFTFEVPLTPAAIEPLAGDTVQDKPNETADPISNLRVLVVDDNPTNRLVLETILAQFGVSSHAVFDGREAVEAWESSAWDAILMDIHMPEMDGVSATLRIRERERELARPRTPIIAVTASVLSHETEGYKVAGMDCCVAKPVEIKAILDALAEARAA